MTVLPAVLVTGGATRIGRSIVTNLAAKGYPVAIHANRSIEEADTLADLLRADGARANSVAANLMDEDETGQLIMRAREAIGEPIGVLINNASVFEKDAVEDFSQRDLDKHMRIHVGAPAQLTALLAHHLPADARGMIVNMIDQRVKRLTPHFFTYTLSKSAQWTMTQTAALALAPRIRVNAVGPGPTLKNARQSDADFDKQVRAVPLQRGPAMDEFADTIDYLWNAKSVTGQLICLDGGQHLAWETPDVLGINE
ncbi:MAG: SDR family oxidoreductase [Pseudomonadota bacterium]